MFLNEKLETMDRKEIEQIQIERLQATLNRIIKVIPFYKDYFQKKNISTEDFTNIEDIQKLPLITREDLVRHHPYGMFSVPLREIVRIYPTSVPFRLPVVVGYTQSDIIKLSKLTARVLCSVGVKKDDVVLINFNGNIINGAFVVMYGAELLGSSVIPCFDSNPEEIIDILRSYRVTKLITTPFNALALSDVIEQRKISPQDLSLESIIVGGEILPHYHQKRIEETFMIKVSEIYGMEEIIGPGVGGECEKKCGIHINDDHFIAEIIDPKTGKSLLEGKTGELVLTTINREGFPLLRYRTGNITSLIIEKCSCGRNFSRIQKILNHTDERLIINGISFLPKHIEKILSSYEHTTKNYRIIIERANNRDRMEIEVGVTSELFVDQIRKMEDTKLNIKQDITDNLRVNASIRLVEPKTIPYPWKKETNIIDKR
ncbi:MAG: AMP-binding protein [Candidatus Aureabacteria bacterium]|nr:AMP-binding protein [Candidatus Auribacterota bacterium]